LLGTSEQRAGGMLLIGDPLATRVLMALYDGYEAHVQHATWFGGDTDIRIGNAHLRPRYEAFARCVQSATAAGWSAFERTRIEYPSNVAGLSEQDQRRLRRVAEYVVADSQVSRIYIDGHTDDVGSTHSNLALSRQRAQQVADYLTTCGVPRDRLVVRYHGAEYPVASEDSEAARAENRRATVRLERHWPDGELANR
jgi:outer membrane protein OmpA-like peptidoglycan-associated protein